MKRKTTSWEWYSIKLLFESTISGEPIKGRIDEYFSNDFKLFEDQIIILKAQSVEHAYRLANIKAVKKEMSYYNPYGQKVQYKFINSINCQPLQEHAITSGIEVYSRLFKVPKDEETSTFIDKTSPEINDVDDGEKTPYYNFLIGSRTVNSKD